MISGDRGGLNAQPKSLPVVAIKASVPPQQFRILVALQPAIKPTARGYQGVVGLSARLHDDQVDSISQALKWMSRPKAKAAFFSVEPLGRRTASERYYPGLYPG